MRIKQHIEIQPEIFKKLGTSIEVLSDRNKSEDNILKRALIYNYLYGRGYSLTVIGRTFNRKHSSVINGLKRFRNLMHTKDERLMELYSRLSTEPKEDELDDCCDENDFQPCCDCDLPDACEDFGCAIKQGLRVNEAW